MISTAEALTMINTTAQRLDSDKLIPSSEIAEVLRTCLTAIKRVHHANNQLRTTLTMLRINGLKKSPAWPKKDYEALDHWLKDVTARCLEEVKDEQEKG